MTKIAETLADELAAAAIEHIRKTGDEDVISLITKTIGDSSQTLQEAFITSVRVQRAAIRARETLAARQKSFAPAPDPTPASDPTPAPNPIPAPQRTPTAAQPTAQPRGPWDLESE